MAGRAAKFHIWLNMQDCRPPCPWLFINGVSSHFSSPKLIKLVIFSCPYWYIENIHFSLIKSNPNPNHEHKRINPTGPIKSMTHNHCHQSCKAFTKGESRTQDHSHSKLGTFRSTTKVLLWTGAELGGCQESHCPPKIFRVTSCHCIEVLHRPLSAPLVAKLAPPVPPQMEMSGSAPDCEYDKA